MEKNVYVFDMGGVIKHSYDYKGFYTSLNCDVSFDKFMSIFIKDLPLVETGEMSEDTFFKNIIMRLNLPINLQQIKAQYSKYVNFLYEDAIKVLKMLKAKDYDIYLFSDLKPIDFANLSINLDVTIFSKVYLSYEIGYRKTDVNAFKYLIKDLNIKPQNILFFDDKDVNIKNAKSLGIRAYQVIGDNILSTFIDEKLF